MLWQIPYPVKGGRQANIEHGRMSFGDRVRDRRVSAGLTQGAVARGIGVDQSTVSDWERNKSVPLATQLPALAECLGTSILYLLEQTDDPIVAPTRTTKANATQEDVSRVEAKIDTMAGAMADLASAVQRTVEVVQSLEEHYLASEGADDAGGSPPSFGGGTWSYIPGAENQGGLRKAL